MEFSGQLRWIEEGHPSMASAAFWWILDQKEVSCINPGFKNQRQIESNLQALDAAVFGERTAET
jgi:aryl-alcohol dehydrogenase-like predicted oxidoreductase